MAGDGRVWVAIWFSLTLEAKLQGRANQQGLDGEK